MIRRKEPNPNPNSYIRTWEVRYRKSKWVENDYEIKKYQCTFKKLLKILKKIMDKDIYTDFVISEVEK